ncbi:MAG: hypothetical protein Q8S73_06010 [Deltaproteobacteria bacterium]|nr:hypothetical protein [Myxococcales bacterium]MDP3213638.1 hypothetical protein [Deltaproteobacteria bacterium]
MHSPSPDALHPTTGLALVQPRDVLISDHDLERLAAAEKMFLGYTERDRLLAVGIEHMDATG